MSWHTSSRALAFFFIIALLVASAGCHQVKIDSGREPSPTVYHDEWNIAFAYAIFPAQIDAHEYCGGVWARVETKQSFLNWVVGALTFGVITPMESKVVCAASAGSAARESTDHRGEDQSEPPALDPSIE